MLYSRLSGEGDATCRQVSLPARRWPSPGLIGFTRRFRNCCAAVSGLRPPNSSRAAPYLPKNVLARTGVEAAAAKAAADETIRPMFGATRRLPVARAADTRSVT